MRDVDLASIFPINDAASARLMIVKAECLRSAGVISEVAKQAVLNRARAVIEEREPQRRLKLANRTVVHAI
jgi:hypothetical protein